ncbi:MAG: hypothetical protein ACFFEK_15825, partial [Candidatus Thorarchaeota archaeon]
MTFEPYLILSLFFGLVPLSRIINHPRALRRISLKALLSEILGKDIESIKASTAPPHMFSSAKTLPMLNIRPTYEERKIVQCIKPFAHCQNCTYCTKTAVIHNSQWIYCKNPNRVTTNGSNKHYWHSPDLALPCHS